MDARTSAGRPMLLEPSADTEPGGSPRRRAYAAEGSTPQGDGCGAAGSPWLPGLEPVAALPPDAVWLHDVLLGPFSADIVGYLGLARETGGPVLDLGSGAGRLAVPFARHGFTVEAVDRDARSLDRLRAWAERVGPHVDRLVTTTQAELTELRLRKRYRLVVLAGAAVSAIPPEARPALFREIAAHLDEGGALALDYTAHLSAGLVSEPRRTWTFQVPRFDHTAQVVRVRQLFDTDAMRELITYESECSGSGRVHRTRLRTEKWVVDPERLRDDLRSAGLVETEVSHHRIDRRTRNTFLVCRCGPK